MDNGAIFFIKYALAPNKLRYCGPSNNREIFNYFKAQKTDEELFKLLAKFEGAYPYLEYIAHVNKIADPFNFKVVEAYWIGNELLNNVSISHYHQYLKDRFKGQWDKKIFNLIFFNNQNSAKPHHSFQVLSLFAKKKKGDKVLYHINNCLISTAVITEVSPDKLSIKYQPLIINNNNLVFDKIAVKKIKIDNDYMNNIIRLKKGDFISCHWGQICDKLTDTQYKSLNFWNQYHINIINKII